MLIQVSSGQGPKECEYACYRVYQEFLKEFKGLDVVSINKSHKNCLKSVVFYSEKDLSSLEGTIQWICESPFRKHHKRKNWFVDVSILKEEKGIKNQNDIKYEVFRSQGKGGQNVNKVSTAIRAIHISTGVSVVSQDQRSQLQNKKIAYVRLMQKIDEVSSSINKDIHYENWNEHNLLKRGLPLRVYKGMKFQRIK
ncbi:peptide chain release factor H [Candidatus Stoquefichus massiliensis]|uniref:peptide chain release factor H n=1 Tax=Candidatus Stoquefichus massiliensis TaxID=1470350 RepID=UPI0004831824|nr:peptide chain release factor H [Candidatus Stoquefichus massiliensis]